MRRLAWYEDEQAYADEQEADLRRTHQRNAKQRGPASSDLKTYQPGEEQAIPIPLPPRPWLYSVAYTNAGRVAVPKKPYHQQATLVGTGGVAFDVSYSRDFPQGSTAPLPGDRNHLVKVYAGQELWMRSAIIVGELAVIVEPWLDAIGNAVRETDGEAMRKSVSVDNGIDIHEGTA